MNEIIKNGIAKGLERISAWSDLLDRINVYPVADGDTGRNLKMSLTPLLMMHDKKEDIAKLLLLSARGNSGNISSQFFSSFIKINDEHDIAAAVERGRERAWKAVSNPKQGTMLTIFDALNDFYKNEQVNHHDTTIVERIIEVLEKAVQSTPELLPKLKEAGVVDSGALGIFIFFEGFYCSITESEDKCVPITERFKDMLHIAQGFTGMTEEGFCIDTVLRLKKGSEHTLKKIAASGENVIIIPEQNYIKVHLHTKDRDEARKELESLGVVLNWSYDDLSKQIQEFANPSTQSSIHIMTDAAGSITRENARLLGVILMESYITVNERSLPETQFSPDDLYRMVRNGSRAGTSQASKFERHQSYASALSQYETVVYLCVGSVFTGNYLTAIEWKREHDSENRFFVIDSGAASGKLGLCAIATARYANYASSADAVIEYANRAINCCEEYIFVDKLHYLAAGGRLSKTSAFFGDMLHMKPVISPTPEGAKKVGVVKNEREQIRFAMEKIDSALKSERALIMLEYTDNKDWVEKTILQNVQDLFPGTDIILQPLSLTTGVHTGPGTWGIAFLPIE